MKPDNGKTTRERMECIYSHKHNCKCYMKKKTAKELGKILRQIQEYQLYPFETEIKMKNKCEQHSDDIVCQDCTGFISLNGLQVKKSDWDACCTAIGEIKTENPKESVGDTKTPHHLVPPRVLKEVAWAMKEGADKYGAYNFRKAGVKFHTYYSSTRRHMDDWFEGEDIDSASGLNHVVKAIAGLCVLYDSILEENFIDDRPNTK